MPQNRERIPSAFISPSEPGSAIVLSNFALRLYRLRTLEELPEIQTLDLLRLKYYSALAAKISQLNQQSKLAHPKYILTGKKRHTIAASAILMALGVHENDISVFIDPKSKKKGSKAKRWLDGWEESPLRQEWVRKRSAVPQLVLIPHSEVTPDANTGVFSIRLRSNKKSSEITGHVVELVTDPRVDYLPECTYALPSYVPVPFFNAEGPFHKLVRVPYLVEIVSLALLHYRQRFEPQSMIGERPRE